MAEKSSTPDVNEMFQKMGEKLGWFKQKNLNEAKQLMTQSAEKTKMKNEKGDHAFDHSNGKKAAKLKLKKKSVKANLAAEQKEKPVVPSRNNLHHAKAQSFKVVLSSDSDSSFTSEPQHSKGCSRKAVLQICSDSDADESPVLPARVTNHSDACVKESFLEPESGTYLQDFEPILDVKPKRNSYIDWNDTVVKNRVSLASFTEDLDNLGEPLVESTRIHRRSSVTYKQIIDSPDSSKEDVSDLFAVAAKGNIKEGAQEFKHADENLPNLTSICEETKYITAIETVDDTLGSSDSHINAEKTENNSSSEEGPNYSMEFRDKGKICVDKQSSHCNSDRNSGFERRRTKQRELNSSDLSEEVEVVDAATQTDESEAVEKKSVKPNNRSSKKVHKAYKENTVVDNSSEMTDFEIQQRICNDIYDEDTVEYSHISADIPHEPGDDFDQSDSRVAEQPDIACTTDVIFDLEARFASTTIQTCANEYSKQTIGNEFETECSLKADVYNEITDLGNSKYAFEQDTDIRDSSDIHFESDFKLGKETAENMYEGITNDESNSDSMIAELKADSEESMYEVCDAVTQTVEIDQVVEEHGFICLTVDVGKNSGHNDDEGEICKDEFNEYEQNEMEHEKDIDHAKENEESSNESDGTESSKEENFASTDNSIDTSDSTNFAILGVAKKADARPQKTDMSKNSNIAEQSWRSERKYSSDSSDDGDLEAFFQKLKKPAEKNSDSSSPVSMKNFIVEDDDITSESEDSGFYLRETLEMENRKGSQIVSVLGSDDESDEFSSKIYPSSVTKHKKRKQAKVRKQTNVSWSFSSDSEEEMMAENNKPARKPSGTSKKMNVNDKQHKFSKTSARNARLEVDSELSSDSDDEVFNIKTYKSEVFTNDKERFIRDKKSESGVTASVSGTDVNGTGKSKLDSGNFDEVLFKTPNILRKKKMISDDNKENVFKTPVTTKGKVTKTPKSSSKPVYISLSDTDSDNDSSGFTVSLSDSSANSKTSGTPVSFGNLPTPLSLKNTTIPKSTKITPTCTFLKSLSNTVDDRSRHAEARRFVNSFNKYREELSTYLFKLYNKTIFENKLPSDMPVVWNKRLLRTAGYCAYKKNARNDKDRSTRIELSVKVCDNAERVRDTLVHEMCHAAVWLLNGVNGGHGPYWKFWARQATRIHPELPAVSVCHSYSINTKFTYRCKTCGYSIGRHSKSLDVKKKVCGYCRGEFELIRNSVPTSASSTPRPPSKFALFVKDNYNSIKRQNQSFKHGDVMKELSKLFAESKITS